VDESLSVQDVSAGYGKLLILNGVSLEAEKGKVTVVVGPNGSGKSTLLKTVAG
jgi:ABC-type cobalamin/Fe3+-siderophores transport system ATPase subunit